MTALLIENGAPVRCLAERMEASKQLPLFD